MAENPTPEEEIPPRERFERLVDGPEPKVFPSVHNDPPEEVPSFDEAPPHSSENLTEPPVVGDTGSVLERFDALKRRLESPPARPTPPVEPPASGTEPETPPVRPDETAEEAPTPKDPDTWLGRLDSQIRSTGRDEREAAEDLKAEPSTPFETAPDAPTYDDLERLKMEEAAEKRQETRKAKRKARRQNRSFWKELPVLILVSIVVAIVIKTFFFQAFYIPSASMVPTLEVNDRVLVNKLSYQFGAIERGDILVFDSPEAVDVERSLAQRVVRRVGEATGLVSPDTVLIKRVIGLPGEVVEVRDNQVYVNDSPIAEPYLAEGVTTRDMDPVIVPADHVFMMGDNRNQSRDSRVFGPINRDDVVGRAFVRVWPVSRWSGL